MTTEQMERLIGTATMIATAFRLRPNDADLGAKVRDANSRLCEALRFAVEMILERELRIERMPLLVELERRADERATEMLRVS